MQTNKSNQKQIAKKIQELEKIVFQLQNDNEKKQKEIDDLINVQKKFAKDIIQLWKQMNAAGQTKNCDSQKNSQLSLQKDQYTMIQKDLEQQTKQTIQQEIQKKFNLINDSLLKRSEFENYFRKIQEEIEMIKLKLVSESEYQYKKRNSFQENYNMQFNLQMNKNDIKYQTLQKQQFDRKEQVLILDTQVEYKQI